MTFIKALASRVSSILEMDKSGGKVQVLNEVAAETQQNYRTCTIRAVWGNVIGSGNCLDGTSSGLWERKGDFNDFDVVIIHVSKLTKG